MSSEINRNHHREVRPVNWQLVLQITKPAGCISSGSTAKANYATLCNNENPFGMGNLTCISNAEDSKKLSDRKQAMTIVPAYQQVVEI